MCHTISDTDFYKILSILSPFVSAFLAGLLTYYFTLKTKKFDILYQNKIPAFKETVSKLVDLKKFCLGRIAYFQGNEFSPYFQDTAGALHHRTEISNIYELNAIFLSSDSKKVIDNLLNEMSGLCNAEIAMTSGDTLSGVEKEYDRILKLTENCISTLYTDLNLKNI